MESSRVIIHARFANDGSVREIGECPSGISPQDWFNALSRHSANGYEALSGGRGIFRLAPAAIEQAKAAVLSPAT
ncbi:hypothetical protein GL267_007470 [Acidithiobacillus ferrianus]|uniref:Uncharacterized protein n=2 Tax=Acidithiobacillus ferrianus TaxID=2678518 RepID=A0A845UL81_9PROT|nr:hypothetical protein [Acidithiobacillus ferrianus]NDU42398.1 hypothetical protein [Acidithiobacillus ferrianus]